MKTVISFLMVMNRHFIWRIVMIAGGIFCALACAFDSNWMGFFGWGFLVGRLASP